PQAAALFRKVCDEGDTRGAFDHGVTYLNGDGVAKGAAQAVALFRKACDGGDARGCSNLGVMYANGDGVAKDAAQAVALYRKACDGGDAEGCTHFGKHGGDNREAERAKRRGRPAGPSSPWRESS